MSDYWMSLDEEPEHNESVLGKKDEDMRRIIERNGWTEVS